MTESSESKITRELPPGFRLFPGGHSPPIAGRPLELCFDEAVAWIAGEAHSGEPQCMCPVLAAAARCLNDSFDDDERQLLVPLVHRCVGTRSTIDVMRRRSYSLVDAAIRDIVPMGLDAAAWSDLAAALREVAPVADSATAEAAYCAAAAAAARAAAGTRSTIEVMRRRRYSLVDAAIREIVPMGLDAAAAAWSDIAATLREVAPVADSATAEAVYCAAAAARASAAAAVDHAATAAERAHIRSQTRRPIVLATIAAFERAISIT